MDPEYPAALFRDPSAYCCALAATIDHVEALTRRGPGDWTNLTVACADCNRRKHMKPLLTFAIGR